MMKEATLRRKNTSWAGSERLLGNEAWNATVLDFVMLQLEVLISYVSGPNFRFRCDKRGVRTGVRWCLGWPSVVWSLEVWGLSLTWSSLRWFQSVAVRTKKLNLFSYKWPQDSLRLRRFWSFEGEACPRIALDFRVFRSDQLPSLGVRLTSAYEPAVSGLIELTSV